MKMKRILSALVAAATAFSVIGSQAVFAAGETYVKNVDFNNIALQENNTGTIWPNNSSISVGTKGAGSFSIKQESEGDHYVQYNISEGKTGNQSLLWFKLDKDYSAPIYIEFDCRIANMRRNIFMQSSFEGSNYFHNFFTLSPEGKVTLGDSTKTSTTPQTNVVTADIPVKADMWYHISIGFADNKALCYIDGEKIIEMPWAIGGMTSKNSSGSYEYYTNIFTGSSDNRAETISIDNFKVYQSENGFDDAFAGNAAYIESVADGVGFDKTNLKLELTNDMLDAETILNSVTPAAGATAVCDMESGTLTVTSQNKKISRIYTFSVPAFTSRAYTIDTDKETISTLYKYTSVADFLSSFTVNSGKIELVKNDVAITDGFVSEGMALRYFEDEEYADIYTDYTLVFDNGIVNEDFENVTLADNWHYGHGTTLGAANPGKIHTDTSDLSIVSDEEKGSKVMKYTGTAAVLFAMNSDYYGGYKSYNYSGYNFEISFKALDDNAQIQLITKDGENGSGNFGTDIFVKSGGNLHWYYTGANAYKTQAAINEWHNVVYSVRTAKDAEGKSQCTIYLDGEKVGEYSCEGKPENIRYERIVFSPTDTTKSTTMLIDDVKIYPIKENIKTEYFDDRYIAVSAAEGTNVLTVSGNEIALTSDNTPIGDVGDAIIPNENVADMVFVNSDGSVVDEEEFNVSAGMKLITRNMTGESVRVYNFTVAPEPALAVYDANNARLTGKFTAGTLYAKASDAALTGECLLVLASYSGTELADCRVVTVSQETNSAAELTVGDDATAVKAFLISKGTLAPAAGAVSLSK